MAIGGTDPLIVEQLRELGGEHLRRCYQCGTCSVVCPRTPLDGAFPRKEMVWAQWGLEDKLAADADAWLCYQCNECIVNCPVDARPGDLMAALRAFQISHYAVPRFMTKVSQGPRYLALAFAIPIAFVALLLAVAIGLGDGELSPEGPVLFEKMIPHVYIDVITLALLATMLSLAAVGARRFWRAISAEDSAEAKKQQFGPALRSTIRDVLTHRDFKDCKQNRRRAYAHMAIFYGFLCLVAATTGAFIYTVVFDWVGIGWQDNELSLPLWDPVKIIGNVGFLLLLGGGIWATARHIRHPQEAGSSHYFDWFFIGLVYLTTLTGFGLMVLRLADLPDVAYPFYAVHLVFVYGLFAYFPYSKFAHVVYRILANTHAKQIGRQAGEYTGDGVVVAMNGDGVAPAAVAGSGSR
jgi:quinone-modifying oxidoreductase subunit QmoC